MNIYKEEQTADERKKNEHMQGRTNRRRLVFYPTIHGRMDDMRFYGLLTVFQSYQDDVWMIMKGCVQWNSVYG